MAPTGSGSVGGGTGGSSLVASFDVRLLQPRAAAYERIKCLSQPDVFLFRHRDSNAQLVATVTDLERVNDDELEHIVRGVKITTLLKHENLLPFLTTFVDLNDLWTISPHYDLGSASDLSKPFGIEDEVCLAYIIRDVLTALDYLHNRALIHRAVRGSHILVSSKGRCVLSGLKYCTSVIKDGKWQISTHDYPNYAASNLNWLSPEILEQNLLGYDYKSDIYSVGITCCELANGVVPFDNLHPTEMLLDKLTGHYPKPLDESCAHLITLPEGMTDEEREKYRVYESRRFSETFHAFTVELCLVSDPCKRPTAAQLLNHRFFKTLKKAPPAETVFSEVARILSTRDSSMDGGSSGGGGGGGKLPSVQPDNHNHSEPEPPISWTFP